MAELYVAVRKRDDGTEEIYGYAYGDPWVAMGLYTDDIRFDTEEEAKAWWEKNYGGCD